MVTINSVAEASAPNGHVLFIHGLDGHFQRSWRDEKRSDSWLDWLGADLPGHSIWSVGYSAPKSDWQGWASHLQDRGPLLLDYALATDALSKGHLNFVGHSLGGLVIKQMLRTASDRSEADPRARAFLGRVRRVVFLATPHLGAPMAESVAKLELVARPSAATLDLVKNSPSLRDLNNWYRMWSRNSNISHRNLSEGKPISGLGYSHIIVPPEYSDLGIVESTITEEDHISIAKPNSILSDVYIIVRDFLSPPISPSEPLNLNDEIVRRLKELTALAQGNASLRSRQIATVAALEESFGPALAFGEIRPHVNAALGPQRQSNSSPDGQILRDAAREAMSQNRVSDALHLMERAERVEAQLEAAQNRRAAALQADADDALQIASALRLSRARLQAGRAAIHFSLGELEASQELYKSAVAITPFTEENTRQIYLSKLRLVLNNILLGCSDFPSARSRFDLDRKISPPDVYSFSILIHRAPNYATARDLLAEMAAADVEPNVVTFSTLIAAAPDYATARDLLAEMTAAGIKPNVVTYNTLIAAAPDYARGRDLLAEMTVADAEPDVFTFSTLIAAAPDYATARDLLAEMAAADVEPNVVTFSTLIAAAPDYATARDLLAEMTATGIKPNVVTYNTLIAAAPDYATARDLLAEMTAVRIRPDVFTFSTLIAAAPDYATARDLLAEMTAADVEPNVVTFSTLIAAAPDYATARDLLAEMTAAGIKPVSVTVSAAAVKVRTFEDATELRTMLRAHTLAGTGFHEAVFSAMCPRFEAKAVLDWALGEGRGAPFPAFGAAIASYRRSGDLNSALRVASAFPYLPAAESLFKRETLASVRYLRFRFDQNQEAHYAARALGYCFAAVGNKEQALHWFSLAINHPESTPRVREFLRQEIRNFEEA